MTDITSVLIILACFFMIFIKSYYSGHKSALIQVRSKRDGHMYSVLPGIHSQTSADTLSIVTDFASHVVDYLVDSRPTDPRVQLLFKRLNKFPLRFTQFQPKPGEPVAVTHDMGRGGVQLCLYNPNNTVVAINAVKSVVLHEISHLMQHESGPLVDGFSQHGKAFKAIERMLLRVANKLGHLPATGAVGCTYCGISIPDPDTAK